MQCGVWQRFLILDLPVVLTIGIVLLPSLLLLSHIDFFTAKSASGHLEAIKFTLYLDTLLLSTVFLSYPVGILSLQGKIGQSVSGKVRSFSIHAFLPFLFRR